MKNILLVLILIITGHLSAQNSQINWSSFSAGFGQSTSLNLSLRSIAGQPLIGRGSNNTSIVGSGFFYNPNAAGIVTKVEDNSNIIPSVYKLEQNYPNPFNPTTKIRLQIPVNSHVLLNVFDVLGNKVATLVNEEKPAGTYEVEFNDSHLSSGVYFYKIKAGNFMDTKKMILLR